jgi:hypothetical protein
VLFLFPSKVMLSRYSLKRDCNKICWHF